MKTITKLFLVFQLLDVLISAVAIQSGIAYEGNPIGFTWNAIIIKLLITNLVCFTLEKINFSRLIWIIPGISGLVVWWNCLVIGIELLAKLKVV